MRDDPDYRPTDDDHRRFIEAKLIADCDLCDDEGVRGMLVCDHTDYAEIAKRGMAKVRAALAKGQTP